MGEGGSRRLTDEESFSFVVNTSPTAIARTPKTHFIRFGEPRSGPLDVCNANSTVACDLLSHWGRLFNFTANFAETQATVRFSYAHIMPQACENDDFTLFFEISLENKQTFVYNMYTKGK